MFSPRRDGVELEEMVDMLVMSFLLQDFWFQDYSTVITVCVDMRNINLKVPIPHRKTLPLPQLLAVNLKP